MLYGFYHFFLSQHKILIFNRIYLISSLAFSLVIPLIIIPVESGFTITESLNKFTIPVNQTFQYQEISGSTSLQIKYLDLLTSLFIIISSVLLIRFVINIYRILRKADGHKKVEGINSILILVDEDILPYSFFKYVFVNKSDFENGEIDKELLMHEEAHRTQYHSIDIIFLEMVNVFFWFNPAIWLFKKAIILNHEYYADDTVISNIDSCGYQQLLISLVVRNNSYSMVSSIKNTLIKNRLIMMTKCKPLHKAMLKMAAGVSLILFIGVAFTLCKADKSYDDSTNLKTKSSIHTGNTSNQWWNPIVIKHGIKNESFTVHEQFVIFGKKTTSGDTESFTDVVAISNREDSTYCIYKSNTASYDINNKLLNIENCSMNIFKRGSKNTKPVESYANINFSADFIKSLYMMVDH